MNYFDRGKENQPDVSELLHSYRNIDRRIQLEVEAIEAGKKVSAKFLFVLDQMSGDQSCREQAREVLQEVRALEMDHLLRYRQLMTVKYRCLRGFSGMDDDAAAILTARAVDGKGWSEIAGEFQYSESQARRRYQDALKLFTNTLKMNDICA